ncbi:hypothetical protein LXL04_027415 [Taraxacum kok-saghyz]
MDYVVHRFEIVAECVGGTCLMVAAMLRMIREAISNYHFASGTKLGRGAKNLSQLCLIEVADVKTLMVRHECQRYTLEREGRRWEEFRRLWRQAGMENSVVWDFRAGGYVRCRARGFPVLRLEIYFAGSGCLMSRVCLGLCDYLCSMGKYMARTRLIKAGIMMTE